jgi:hypothetical protein
MMKVKIDSLTFPSFYAECAYRDGARDAKMGTRISAASFMHHGDPEPVGMAWYEKGIAAATLGLV